MNITDFASARPSYRSTMGATASSEGNTTLVRRVRDPEPGGDRGAGALQASRGGQLLSALQQLQVADPAKFKQVVSDIADQLSVAAYGATGNDQQLFQKLADKFTAAENGDLSGFQSPSLSAQRTPAQVYQQTAELTDPVYTALYDHQALSTTVQKVLDSIPPALAQALGNNATSSSPSASTRFSALA